MRTMTKKYYEETVLENDAVKVKTFNRRKVDGKALHQHITMLIYQLSTKTLLIKP